LNEERETYLYLLILMKRFRGRGEGSGKTARHSVRKGASTTREKIGIRKKGNAQAIEC